MPSAEVAPGSTITFVDGAAAAGVTTGATTAPTRTATTARARLAVCTDLFVIFPSLPRRPRPPSFAPGRGNQKGSSDPPTPAGSPGPSHPAGVPLSFIPAQRVGHHRPARS